MISATEIRSRDIAQELEQWAPLALAESYDNAGLLVGRPQQVLSGVLVSLDMTMEVVEEALEKGCNMVVAHHPIWFGARTRLVEEDYVSRAISLAIRHDIQLYAIHTNLDNVYDGVSLRMAQTLGLISNRLLLPRAGMEEAGTGIIGELPQPLGKEEFLALVAGSFLCGGIRYADAPSMEAVKTVAVCGGAGSFLTATALAAGVDAFVTADITYHKFFDNESRMLLLDIGHFESEQFTPQLIAEFLLKKFPRFAVRLSRVVTNPVRYFSPIIR